MKLRILLFLLLVCMATAAGQRVRADTDGNELQVFVPSKLEIQLGTDWANTKFELKTDMGVYPAPIFTDANGILRLEIGGSDTYILSCLSMGSIHETSPASTPATTQSKESSSSSPEGHTLARVLILVFIGALIFIAGVAFGRIWFYGRGKTA